MNIRNKWGDLYPGFLLMSGAEIHLTKEDADVAMKCVVKRYHNQKEQLRTDLKLFRMDLRIEDAAMKSTPHCVKQPTTMSVGRKLLAIWEGYS